MGHHEDGLAVMFTGMAQEPVEGPPGLNIHPGGRLILDEEVRISREDPS